MSHFISSLYLGIIRDYLAVSSNKHEKENTQRQNKIMMYWPMSDTDSTEKLRKKHAVPQAWCVLALPVKRTASSLGIQKPNSVSCCDKCSILQYSHICKLLSKIICCTYTSVVATVAFPGNVFNFYAQYSPHPPGDVKL